MARLYSQQGTEGPAHDPYAFKRITFISTDGSLKVEVHMGLDEWIKVNGEKIATHNSQFMWRPRVNATVDEVFERHAQISLDKAERILARRHAKQFYYEDYYA